MTTETKFRAHRFAGSIRETILGVHIETEEAHAFVQVGTVKGWSTHHRDLGGRFS